MKYRTFEEAMAALLALEATVIAENLLKTPLNQGINDDQRINEIKEIKKNLYSDGLDGWLSSYRDYMDLVNRHPTCLYAIHKWNIYPQALTKAIKAKGVQAVMSALTRTKAYAGTRNPAHFFWWLLKNPEAEHC